MIFAVVKFLKFHRACIIEEAQFHVDVCHQMSRKHVLSQLQQQIVVRIFDKLAQITRKLRCAQIKVVKSLEILHIVFAVVSEPCADILVDSQLENVQDKLGDDLIGAGKDLLDDGVVLTAEWNNCLENVFAANVTGLN